MKYYIGTVWFTNDTESILMRVVRHQAEDEEDFKRIVSQFFYNAYAEFGPISLSKYQDEE